MKIVLSVIAAAAALSANAFAMDRQDIEISFDRNLLASLDGQLAVYEMMKDAAKDICADEFSKHRQIATMMDCKTDVVDQLVVGLDNVEVTQIHRSLVN